MKNINYIKKALLLVAFSIAIISCDRDDNVGGSVTDPSSPATTITLNFDEPVTLTENDQEFSFSVTLSTTQAADIKLYVKQIGGDADSDDFEATGLITISAGSTSGSGTIKILHDEIIEGTETLTLQIGDERTANTSMTPATAQFTILNVTSDDLVIDLAWATSTATTDSSGDDIDATDFADMRLLLMDTDGNVLDSADGGSFETYVLSGLAPNMEYYIGTDFYAAMGDPIRDLDLMLEFNQTGKINHEMYDYGAVIDNGSICANNFYVMASVVKTDGNYVIENVGVSNFRSQLIEWGGIDTYDFYAPDGWDSKIVTSVDCVGNKISGLNAEWMFEVWGEVIETEGDVYFTVSDGTVTIAEQYVFTTSYSGSLYDYTVSATGTWDAEAGTLHLEYVLLQDGWDVGGYWNSVGGMDTPYYVADLVIE